MVSKRLTTTGLILIFLGTTLLSTIWTISFSSAARPTSTATMESVLRRRSTASVSEEGWGGWIKTGGYSTGKYSHR